jgi:signal transduction histidine kinase
MKKRGGQRVEQDLADARLVVLADRRFVRQLLSNLLSNASKYSPEGELSRIRAERSNGHVWVAVEDRGPGIPPEHQAGLFERFYRLRPGDQQPGIGLGLAIAKGIVEAHGGSIGVDSEVGAGTCVWFTLLAAEESAGT